MELIRVGLAILFLVLLSFGAVSANESPSSEITPIVQPLVGSWIFSGRVTNESGDPYGYFFYMQRQGAEFHVKTAVIDGEKNQLVLFYEGTVQIQDSSSLDWHVGRSFIRFNPINDSWIFGVALEDGTGFKFKVDMLQQVTDKKSLTLRPGVELQALQTSRLNGHLQIAKESKEQFVTGNNAWFGKLWFTQTQKADHNISTAFCRLSNDHGFYSANLKESDATGASVAGWRDALGNKVKMSQFISIGPLSAEHCLLHVGLPRLHLNVVNTLKDQAALAGFSKENPNSFCFIAEQSFKKEAV